MRARTLISTGLLGLLLLPLEARAANDELTKAYKKEFAFLKAEKSALEQRLTELDQESERKLDRARGEVEQLQRQLLGLRNQADELEMDLQQVERESSGVEERGDLVGETMSRAADSLRRFDLELEAPAEEPADQAAQLETMFGLAADAIERGGAIRKDEGEFFLADGTQTKGELLHIGQIATYGKSPKGGGALAPAGGGRLKAWHESAFETAKTLMAGQRPAELSIFLYESLDKGVNEKQGKTALEEVESGGIIAWVIICLGGLALLMIVARIYILVRASSRTDALLNKVGALIDQGLADQALAILKKSKGAAARVLRATVRNLDRDRQHLEDLVSESILHETPHVERFGTTILVFAAVAPLLGLLGTVTGMIATFDVITEFGTGDPKLLSGGISEALVTTKLGLMVAIPTLLIGTILSGRANAILETMERAALQVMNRSDAYKAKHERLKTGEGAPTETEKKQEPGESEPKATPRPSEKAKAEAEADEAEPDAQTAVNEAPA
jgi:biopolymer transport protein ExbB